MTSKSRRWAAVALLTAALSATTGVAAAAGAGPIATTGAASNITATSASLNGTVSPSKAATTYYFQYGTSTSYGATSPAGTANGNSSKAVTETVGGLTSAKTYHYRLVATNANGTSDGADRTFTTAATGTGTGGGGKNSVSVTASPTNITWGRTSTLSGKVTGPKSGGEKVTLQSTPYPYTRAYHPTGAMTTTSTSGTFTFVVRPGQNTRYEAVVATKTPATSVPVRVGVKVKVSFHLSTLHPVKGQSVRFYGWVTPAHNAKWAQIQRRTSTGAWKTIATTKLVAGGTHNGTAVSKFSKRLRLYRSGTYRVRVNPSDGNHLPGNSATRTEHIA